MAMLRRGSVASAPPRPEYFLVNLFPKICRDDLIAPVFRVKQRIRGFINPPEKMKYIILVHHPKSTFDAVPDPADVAAGRAYGEALHAAGVFVAGAGLVAPQNATTVSVREGKRQVQDGPYAETKEFLAGFVVIDVPNLDAALEWAARNPAAAKSSVEVRPLAGSYFALAK